MTTPPAPAPAGPVCPKCGTPLAAASVQGLCPACLLAFHLAPATQAGAAPGDHAFTPPTAGELGDQFPQLEIIELIGRGGMGAVYRARQRELDRLVALKILPRSLGDDPAFADRFTREARALAKLSHPGIVTIHDFGRTADGLFYILMEFVDGVNLRQLLAGGRIAPREALAIVPELCDALQYAHDRGIVHRDIKPENILLDRRGHVKIADFGLAKLVGDGGRSGLTVAGVADPGSENPGLSEAGYSELTEAGKVMGTPSYMAPEQTSHPGAVDHRADIYALGVVFYQMLTGELPGTTLQPPSRKVVLDVRLDEVVLRALELEPSRRYQQASALKTQVETIAADPGRGQVPPNDSRPIKPSVDVTAAAPVLPPPPWMRPAGWALLLSGILLLLGPIFVAWIRQLEGRTSHEFTLNLDSLGMMLTGCALLFRSRICWWGAMVLNGANLIVIALAGVVVLGGLIPLLPADGHSSTGMPGAWWRSLLVIAATVLLARRDVRAACGVGRTPPGQSPPAPPPRPDLGSPAFAPTPGSSTVGGTTPLKTIRSHFTTHEHLQTLAGSLLVRQGTGELALYSDRLVFSHAHERIEVPFTALRELRAVRFPFWFSPAGLHTLGLSFEENGVTRRVYFNPTDSFPCFVPRCNELVAEWLTAVAAAVAHFSGRRPVGCDEAPVMLASAFPRLLMLFRGLQILLPVALPALIILPILVLHPGGGFVVGWILWFVVAAYFVQAAVILTYLRLRTSRLFSPAQTPPASPGGPSRPVPVLGWQDRWLWDTNYVTAFAFWPTLLAAVGFTVSSTIWGGRLPYLALLIAFPGLLFAGIYGWVGARVRRLRASLPRSDGEVAEALIVLRPFQSPGLAVLHADRLELVRLIGAPILVPLADIAALSEVRWFNGSRLFWKRGFALDLAGGRRVLVAVPEPFGRRWRAVLSRGSLPELPPDSTGGPPPAVPPQPVGKTWLYQGVDYRSTATLFGLPWLHVAVGNDPATGRQRVARGIIAVGGLAQGVVAVGGVAVGGLTFGGLSLGVWASGGLAGGLIALGGLAVALAVAVGGFAVAPLALGGGAWGYYAFGGFARGVHTLGGTSSDAVGRAFFEPWAGPFLQHVVVVDNIMVILIVLVATSLPVWLSRRQWQAMHPGLKPAGMTSGRGRLVLFLIPLMVGLSIAASWGIIRGPSQPPAKPDIPTVLAEPIQVPPAPAAPTAATHAELEGAFREYERLLTELREATFELDLADFGDGSAAERQAHRASVEQKCRLLADQTALLREQILALGRRAATPPAP